MKPFFETPQVQLYQGDCLEVMPQLPDRSVDAIIADLPYGTTACAWDSVIPFEPLWEQYKRLIKPSGAIVLFGSQPFTSELVMSNRSWFKYCWVWEKSNGTNFLNAPYQPLKVHEDIAVFSCAASSFSKGNKMIYIPQMAVGQEYTSKWAGRQGGLNFHSSPAKNKITQNPGTRYPRSVLRFDEEKGFHPTQKPLELLKYLSKTYTSPGDRILDNTAGSFTTCVAAVNTGRQFIGIEREEKYCQIGQKRISEAIQEIESMLIKPWEIDAPQVQGDQLNLLEVS